MAEKKPKHSSLGASSAHRWIPCPGSVALCEKAPPQADSEYAREGTAAHKLAEKCLEKTAVMIGGNPEDYVGKDIMGFVVDQEMVDAVKLYVDLVRADAETMNAKVEIEKKCDLSSIFRGMFGTNDAVAYARWSKLIVYDYKHGKGLAVDVVDNPQLLYYALGAYIELGSNLEFTEIELVIVQPRAEHRDGPVRRWTIPVQFLTAWSDTLRAAALATQKPDAPRVPGKQCRWCPAQPICPEAAALVMETAMVDFAPAGATANVPAPESLTMEQLVKVLNGAEFVDCWIKSVEQYAEDQAKKGIKIPGYKLVKKRSTRKWINENEVIASLKAKYGQKIFAEPELLSPAQMEKMIGKKEGGTVIVEALSDTPDTGVVLAHEDDKRPAQEPPMLADFK